MMLYVISSTSCYCSKAAPSTLTPRNLLPTISSQLNVIANYSAGHIIHLLQVTNMIISGSQLINDKCRVTALLSLGSSDQMF